MGRLKPVIDKELSVLVVLLVVILVADCVSSRGIVSAGASLGLVYLGLWLGPRRFRMESKRTGDIKALQTQWQIRHENLTRGLGEVIDEQLRSWQFTPAEREVASLLLKGLGIKEIASIRRTSERTARQQCLSIYAKSGVSGRAELSAFFLEDLLLPLTPGRSY